MFLLVDNRACRWELLLAQSGSGLQDLPARSARTARPDETSETALAASRRWFDSRSSRWVRWPWRCAAACNYADKMMEGSMGLVEHSPKQRVMDRPNIPSACICFYLELPGHETKHGNVDGGFSGDTAHSRREEEAASALSACTEWPDPRLMDVGGEKIMRLCFAVGDPKDAQDLV